MGAYFSCGARSSSNFKSIRVVHLNGHVEEFDEPISAGQVIFGVGSSTKQYFVCTAIQLLSSCSSSMSLKEDAQLQPGQIYFMLPYSILHADVSPVDLASLAKRLNAIARTRPCLDYSNNNNNNNHKSMKDGFLSCQTQVWNPIITSSPSNSVVGVMGEEKGSVYRVMQQPWKPILDTIKEKSFTKRSESDLQENGSLISSFTWRSESDLQENDLFLQEINGSRQPDRKRCIKYMS
ncbi:hypothetical protein HN51_064318 [Arachis hypogaea]|uniref:Uncharacterized protein n=1 Tax=Arachis hypogaea TaxID=3818 RepID=A0A445AUW5_ARAHY|nr:uncharacterized protein LOC107642728 [Arachis ipaensis]XP_025630803.1 uncharacterized protein LOC112723595 [Arachis hypogaea]RYR30228.1 hypothetical protein Ahy_B01g055044 [Arachis hypogaea]